MLRRILVKLPNIKFYENPVSGCQVVMCGHLNTWADMAKLLSAFLQICCEFINNLRNGKIATRNAAEHQQQISYRLNREQLNMKPKFSPRVLGALKAESLVLNCMLSSCHNGLSIMEPNSIQITGPSIHILIYFPYFETGSSGKN
jgi:hypothetical protein